MLLQSGLKPTINKVDQPRDVVIWIFRRWRPPYVLEWTLRAECTTVILDQDCLPCRLPLEGLQGSLGVPATGTVDFGLRTRSSGLRTASFVVVIFDQPVFCLSVCLLLRLQVRMFASFLQAVMAVKFKIENTLMCVPHKSIRCCILGHNAWLFLNYFWCYGIDHEQSNQRTWGMSKNTCATCRHISWETPHNQNFLQNGF